MSKSSRWPGEIGPQGERGFQGEQGIRGEQGIQGEPGEIGPQGERGFQGEQGVRGEQGIKALKENLVQRRTRLKVSKVFKVIQASRQARYSR